AAFSQHLFPRQFQSNNARLASTKLFRLGENQKRSLTPLHKRVDRNSLPCSRVISMKATARQNIRTSAWLCSRKIQISSTAFSKSIERKSIPTKSAMHKE